MPEYSQKHQSAERLQIKCIMLPLHVSESDEEKNQLEVKQKIEERYTVLQQLWVISKYKVVGSS